MDIKITYYIYEKYSRLSFSRLKLFKLSIKNIKYNNSCKTITIIYILYLKTINIKTYDIINKLSKYILYNSKNDKLSSFAIIFDSKSQFNEVCDVNIISKS